MAVYVTYKCHEAVNFKYKMKEEKKYVFTNGQRERKKNSHTLLTENTQNTANSQDEILQQFSLMWLT